MRFMIERPVLAMILFAGVLILGVYSLNNSAIELVPEEKLPALSISAGWYGASAEMVLQRVALPIEEEVMGIKWTSKVETQCDEGSCMVRVEFSRGADMNFVYVLLKERMNKLRDKLPAQVELPRVLAYEPDEFRKKPFFTVSLFGDATVFTTRSRVEREVAPLLRSISGLQGVKITGGVPMVIRITTDMERMKALGIDTGRLVQALGRSFYSIVSVTARDHGKEIALSLANPVQDVRDLEKVVVGHFAERDVLLCDVARAGMGYQEMREEGRYNGMPTVVVDIYKQPQASTMALARRIRRSLEDLGRRFKDKSEELAKRLAGLGRIALLILAVIFVILFLTVRDWRGALLIFASVFFSVFATFTAIYIFNIPLNLLTLSGFALGFGMFVDNAVVVYDSILRLREKGWSRENAALEGPRRVLVPVLASTFTTIIVFFSFAWFQGRLRVYYLPLAEVISIALLCSVLVAYTLVPPLAARAEFRFTPEKKGRGHGVYGFFLRYPLFVILPVMAVLAFSFLLFREKVTFGRFFSWYEKQSLNVWLRLPAGSEFADVRDALLKFEKVALAKTYERQVNASIYENSAEMQVTFPPAVEFSAAPYALKEELIAVAQNLAGVGIGISGFDPEGYYYSPDSGSYLPYSIQVRGYDFQRLLKICNDLKKGLLLHRRINEVTIQTDKGYWGSGGKNFVLRPDFSALRRFDLDPAYLLQLISTAIAPRGALPRLRVGDREYEAEIRMKESEGIELRELLDKEFASAAGRPFRLRDVVTVEERPVKGGILRENQEYVAFVRWDYLGSNKAGERVYKAVYKNLELPPGFSKSEEENRFMMKKEEQQQLNWAMVLSLFLVFLIIAILYESVLQTLLIMISIPLALIGVFFAFVIADFPFDSTAYVGVILLFGVVVNNAIILVDHINFYVRQGMPIHQAVAQGSFERIRPIFLTTATGVFGALPLVLFRQAGQTDIWSALALCMVGGLTASALLVLVVLPVFYDLLQSLHAYLRRALR
jgi:HAE1 family hydrophobic/amphiphilic exporter-1